VAVVPVAIIKKTIAGSGVKNGLWRLVYRVIVEF